MSDMLTEPDIQNLETAIESSPWNDEYREGLKERLRNTFDEAWSGEA